MELVVNYSYTIYHNRLDMIRRPCSPLSISERIFPSATLSPPTRRRTTSFGHSGTNGLFSRRKTVCSAYFMSKRPTQIRKFNQCAIIVEDTVCIRCISKLRWKNINEWAVLLTKNSMQCVFYVKKAYLDSEIELMCDDC